MKNCYSIQKEFIPYLEKSLEANQMEQIEEHLSNCSECAGFMVELKLTFQLIDDESFAEIPVSFLEGIENKITIQNQTKTKSRFKQYFLQVLSYAAVIALGLFSGNLIVNTIVNNNISIENSIVSDDFYLNDLNNEPIELFLINEIQF